MRVYSCYRKKQTEVRKEKNYMEIRLINISTGNFNWNYSALFRSHNIEQKKNTSTKSILERNYHLYTTSEQMNKNYKIFQRTDFRINFKDNYIKLSKRCRCKQIRFVILLSLDILKKFVQCSRRM